MMNLAGIEALVIFTYKQKAGMKYLTLQDCDDVSDEKNCRTIYIDPQRYLKSKPPPSIDQGSKLPILLR